MSENRCIYLVPIHSYYTSCIYCSIPVLSEKLRSSTVSVADGRPKRTLACVSTERKKRTAEDHWKILLSDSENKGEKRVPSVPPSHQPGRPVHRRRSSSALYIRVLYLHERVSSAGPFGIPVTYTVGRNIKRKLEKER